MTHPWKIVRVTLSDGATGYLAAIGYDFYRLVDEPSDAQQFNGEETATFLADRIDAASFGERTVSKKEILPAPNAQKIVGFRLEGGKKGWLAEGAGTFELVDSAERATVSTCEGYADERASKAARGTFGGLKVKEIEYHDAP